MRFLGSIFMLFGILCYMILSWFGFFLFTSSNGEGTPKFRNLVKDFVVETNSEYSLIEILNVINNFSIYISITSIVILVIGIILFFIFIKGKTKNIKTYIILFSVVSALISCLLGIVGSIAFILSTFCYKEKLKE